LHRKATEQGKSKRLKRKEAVPAGIATRSDRLALLCVIILNDDQVADVLTYIRN